MYANNIEKLTVYLAENVDSIYELERHLYVGVEKLMPELLFKSFTFTKDVIYDYDKNTITGICEYITTKDVNIDKLLKSVISSYCNYGVGQITLNVSYYPLLEKQLKELYETYDSYKKSELKKVRKFKLKLPHKKKVQDMITEYRDLSMKLHYLEMKFLKLSEDMLSDELDDITFADISKKANGLGIDIRRPTYQIPFLKELSE